MRPFDDDFTLEKMDKQLEEAALPSSALPVEQRNSSNRRLLQDIQRFHQHNEEDTGSLDRVLTRLLESGVSANESIPMQKEGRDLMHSIDTPPTPKRENKHRTFALIAATLFVALLVGSMATLFTMARQGQIIQTNNTTTGGAKEATPAPIPAPAENIYATNNDTLFKLDGKTHQTLWKYTIPLTDPNQPSSFMDHPVVNDGKVFVTAYNGDIHALDSTTGKRIWVAQEGVFAGIVVADGLVVFKKLNADPSDKDIYTIYALNASDGKRIDHAIKMSLPNSEPYFAVVNKIIYIGSANGLSAMNILNGESIWEITIAENEHVNGIAVDNGILYVNTIQTDIPVVGVSVMVGNIKGYFEYGYTLDKPQQKWRHQLDLPLDVQITQPVWGDDGIQYYSWWGQHIVAWKADEGRKLWSFEGAGAMRVADGIVYAVKFAEPAETKIIALDATTGKVLWEKQLTSMIDFIRTGTGKLYTLVYEETTNLTLYEMSTKDGSILRKRLISKDNGMGKNLTIAP